MMMKISVVTVCYNAVKSIEETMLSVLNQTYDNIEYIIIDGGSTDGTVDIIKKYSDRLAYWVSEPDKGIYDAMNKGIIAATGDYINFMNAGDSFFKKDTIKYAVQQIRLNSDIVYGDVALNYDGHTLVQKPMPLEQIYAYQPFCHQCCFAISQLMKSIKFDSKLRILGDYKFFYSQYNSRRTFQYIPLVIALYNANEGASKECISESMKERFLIWGIENNWLLKLPWYFKLVRVQISSAIKNKLPSTVVIKVRKLLNCFRSNSMG